MGNFAIITFVTCKLWHKLERYAISRHHFEKGVHEEISCVAEFLVPIQDDTIIWFWCSILVLVAEVVIGEEWMWKAASLVVDC